MKLSKLLLETLVKETAHLEQFQRQLDEAKETIGAPKITIAIITGSDVDRRVCGCSGIRKSSALDSKADFEIVNESSDPIFYLSHKDGEKPSDFLQYGGVTKYSDHPEVKSFVESVRRYLHESGFANSERAVHPSGFKFMREIKDERLMEMALFGSEFNLNESGPNNVDAVIQGGITLERLGGPFYAMRSSKTMLKESLRHATITDIIEQKMGAEYRPVLLTRYDSGRSNFDIESCRVGVFPKEGKIYTHTVGHNGQVYKLK